MSLPERSDHDTCDLPHHRLRPAAFLDRDGVLNADTCHLNRPEDLAWLEGAREAVLRLNEAGYLVIVVANQAGVARGYYSERDIAQFHARMQGELAEVGARIDAFYTCPFHPEAIVPRYAHPDHPDRKPNPGMIMRALREWPIERTGSFLVGDRESDLEAARRADIPGYLFEGDNLSTIVARALGDQHR